MPERRRGWGGRWVGLAALLALGLAARAAGAETWQLAGEDLRRLHAESLEEVLRACPLLVVERQGAPGLPYRVLAGGARPGELLLVVDGQPWRDPWTGELLGEELPMALVESVAVELTPQVAEFGGEALAGMIQVRTRRPSEPKVTTRLHLSRGSFSERGRHLAFATPPGQLALSVGLDEVFGAGYPFSAYWNGEPDAQSADPEVSFSRRRSLATRLDLAAGGAGPLELALDQSEWHLDRSGSRADAWYREQTRFALALPASPVGSLSLEQRLLGRRSGDGRASDAGVSLRWTLAADSLAARGWRLAAGAERHQLGFSTPDIWAPMPRPARLWLGAGWRVVAGGGLALESGWRLEAEQERKGALAGEAILRWLPAGAAGGELSASLAGGPATTAWERDRVPGLGLWPAGRGAPGPAVAADLPLRATLGLARTGKAAWGRLVLAAEQGGREWIAEPAGEGYAWRSLAGARRRSLDLSLGARLHGFGGELSAAGSLRAERRDLAAPAAEGSFYPLVARGELGLGRPFFAADAHLGLMGGLEVRGGRAGHGELVRVDLGIELQVVDARFWLLYANGLDRAGEELSGFPIPPASLRLGLDWHLDQ